MPRQLYLKWYYQAEGVRSLNERHYACSRELTQKFDREVTLDEVNKAVRELITDQNQVAIMYAPDKESVHLPTEQQIEDIIFDETLKHSKYAFGLIA